MGTLKAKQRNAMAKSTFALPSQRAYPIPDLNHARVALARSSGKPEEATVRRAVMSKFPSLKKG